MSDLKDILKEIVEVNCTSSQAVKTVKKTEEEYFLEYYSKLKPQNDIVEQSNLRIPRFYFKVPKEEDVLAHKFCEEVRGMLLETKGCQLIDHRELETLWILLNQHQTPPPQSGDEQMINYENFCKVGKLVGEKCRNYFTPMVFAKLQQDDPFGRISIMAVFNYSMRKVWLLQTRIGLALYDEAGHGYLRESELEHYIQDLIPTLPQLDGLEISFHSFYVCTAVRKFMFFLDPLRTGKVRILDILACSFLDDLLQLRDEELPKDLQEANWFSAPSALKVYGQYLNLDKNHNGMLSKDELAGYGTGTLTKVFLERVFQECLTYEREMDYKTYLDFVLALENRHEPQALHYLFRILDINNQGYLDTFSLNYFFRAIQKQMVEHDQQPVSFNDVKDEMFDMIKPVDPTRITLQDLLNSGRGETLVSILIDLNGFWTYENRENTAERPDNGETEGLNI